MTPKFRFCLTDFWYDFTVWNIPTRNWCPQGRLRCCFHIHRSEQVEENLVANENILLASTKSRCAQSIFRDELSSSTGSFIQDALAEAESFKSEIEQSAVAREFVAKLQELGAEFPSWELRIVNGSYDVIKHSMPDISGENDRNYSNNPSGDVESPRHKNATKVSTPTVANSGAISKLFERLYYCTRTGKWPKPVTQRISVLSDINLNLRSGKMYLVLGGKELPKNEFNPGSVSCSFIILTSSCKQNSSWFW